MFNSIGRHSNNEINEIAETLIEKLNLTSLSGEVYIGYPIFYDVINNNEVRIDILIVSFSGVIVINYIDNISLDYTRLQDQLYNKIDSKLRNYDFLVHKKRLFFDIQQITYSKKEVEQVKDYPIVFSVEQLVKISEELLIENFSQEQYSNILSGFQEAYGISKRTFRPRIEKDTKSELVNNMEKIIERYDLNQMQAILTDPIGVQRIRGMAGSGKTVILARKAVELHTKYPDWDIVVTFNTRSLKNQLESLIDKFYSIKNNGKKPDYQKLRIINAWGSSKNPGLYYEICNNMECEYYTFSQAKVKFGKRNVFDSVCTELLKCIRQEKKLYDCILIDEAQDFGSNFYKLCLKVLDHNKRLVYAYDELQNINEQAMKSPEEIFGFSIQNDTPLITTYRNQSSVIVSAHAIGMGLYSDTGLIQIPSTPDVWASIGYQSETPIIPGNEATLYRPKETSPDYLNANTDELIEVINCEDLDNQFEILVSKIENDLKEEYLIDTDLMIIDMDSIGHEENRVKLKTFIEEKSLDIKFNVHLAGASSPEDFFRPNSDPISIVYTSINRAKGNEAYQVYIINAQKCINTFSAIRPERQYTFLLYDKSIMQIEYCIENEELIKGRLLFIKLQNKIWDITELQEYANNPEILDDILDEEIGFPIMIRVDFDPKNHIDCKHPKAHFVFSNIKDCRIPMKSVISLGQFVSFILEQVYNKKINALNKLTFPSTITDSESKMIHINW